MPIRKEERAKYPHDWKEIREDILRKVGDRCEWCGVPNHAVIVRDKSGPGYRLIEGEGEYAVAISDDEHPVEVVLTIAHLDHDPTNNDRTNLRALCQKCHNSYDAPHRAQGMKRRRQLAAGQVFFAQATDDEYMADDGMHQADGFNKVN